MLSATGIVAVLVVIGTLIGVATNNLNSTGLVTGAAWTVTMSLLCSWSILWFSRRWESREEDRAIFRFKLLTWGLVLGCVGYLLSQYLLVPWGSFDQPAGLDDLSPRYWKGFYGANRLPLFPAFVAHFGLLFGIVRWWRQSDLVRKHRFSFFAILGSMFFAGIVHCIVPFPQPWGVILAGVVATTVQLASPWLDSSDRKNLQSI
jgi:hypothetical protein